MKEDLNAKLDKILKDNNLVIKLQPILKLQSNGLYALGINMLVEETKKEEVVPEPTPETPDKPAEEDGK